MLGAGLGRADTWQRDEMHETDPEFLEREKLIRDQVADELQKENEPSLASSLAASVSASLSS